MSNLQHQARQFAEARASCDDATMTNVVNRIAETDLPSFFELVGDLVGDGAHQLDGELLHSSLRSAGFDAADALRLANLGAGGLGGYVAAQLATEGSDTGALAATLVAELDELAQPDAGAVERYLRRLLQGTHDARRVTDRLLDAIAGALNAPAAALTSLRDASPATGPATAAARGSSQTSVTLDGAVAGTGDAVDDLFCGRNA